MDQLGQLKITSLMRLGLLEWLETPLIIKTARATILYVQSKMKFRSPPGHFHYEPPLYDSGVRSLTWRRIERVNGFADRGPARDYSILVTLGKTQLET